MSKTEEEKANLDLSLNVLDIVAIVIAITAIVVSIILTTHTYNNRYANEASLEELKEIKELLKNNVKYFDKNLNLTNDNDDIDKPNNENNEILSDEVNLSEKHVEKNILNGAK